MFLLFKPGVIRSHEALRLVFGDWSSLPPFLALFLSLSQIFIDNSGLKALLMKSRSLARKWSVALLFVADFAFDGVGHGSVG